VISGGRTPHGNGEDRVFRGIEDVDWASMGHAYTDSATDVPDLLWGLASDDPERREIALDGMYGAVHHQGDVYDSTVACIPFLFELVGMPTVGDRGAVVGLLCSIWESVSHDEVLSSFCGAEEDEEEWARNIERGKELIRAHVDVFLGLLEDPDAELRAALPGALARVHPDPVWVFGVLRERLRVEVDPVPARSLARAVGRLAVEHPRAIGDEAAQALSDVVSGTPDPLLRLTALARLARCAPKSLPDDTVETVLDVMRLARETKLFDGSEDEQQPQRPPTNTLISHLRELESEHRAAVDADVADDLLDELHQALGDRTDLRFPLLTAQLRSPDRGQRLAAVSMAGLLMTGWRVPDDEPVVALGELLMDPDERVWTGALNELRYIAPVSHAANDGIAEFLSSRDHREPETGVPWYRMGFCRAMEVAVLQGHEPVAPTLSRLLERFDIPEQLTDWITALGAEGAAPLGPVLHERLAELPADEPTYEQDYLVSGLSVLGHRASIPLVIDVLRSTGHRGSRSVAVRALTRYGSAAAEAADDLRSLLADEEAGEEDRLEAAEALWAVAADPAAVPWAGRNLGRAGWLRSWTALRLTAALGPAGVSLAPRLRELLADGHMPAETATALWRVTGDAAEALPALLAAWTDIPASRPEIAACLLEMGSAAAPALPLIRAETASPRRHNNDGSTGNMRYNVAKDVALLRDCRALLERLESSAASAGTAAQDETVA
jgi:hypothetical protein